MVAKRTSHAVSNISCRSYMIPIVEYSGNTIRSIPGRPLFVPLTMSHILRAFSRTSSFVCNRGIGYWNTHTPTVSGIGRGAKREFESEEA